MNPMNRSNFFALATVLLAQLVALSADADTQRFAERSLAVNVNQASVAELMTLPGIGPDIAIEIVKNRPYKSVGSLLRVKGIGECTLGAIAPYVRVEGKTVPYVPE